MSKIKEVTIHQDEIRIKELDRISELYRTDFNNLLIDLKKVYPIKSKEDFLRCYKDIRRALTDKAISELSIPLEGLRKEVLDTMVKLPDESESLLIQISSIKNKRKSEDVLSVLDYKGSEFEINQSRLEKIKDVYRIKIKESEQIERFDNLNKLTDIINELQLVKNNSLNSILRVFSIYNSKVIIKPEFIIKGYE